MDSNLFPTLQACLDEFQAGLHDPGCPFSGERSIIEFRKEELLALSPFSVPHMDLFDHPIHEVVFGECHGDSSRDGRTDVRRRSMGNTGTRVMICQ